MKNRQISTSPSPLAVIIGFAFMYIAWGGTYLAVKLAIAELPVFFVSGSRFLVAGMLLLLAVAAFDRPGFRLGTLREWKDAVVIGMLLLGLGIGTGNWVQQYVTSSFAAMVFSGLPLWIIVIDWLRPGGVAPTRMVTAGLVLGLCGIAIILSPSTGTVSTHGWAVSLLLVLASISWGSGAVFSRFVVAEGSRLLPVGRQMVVAGVALLSAASLHGDFAQLQFRTIHTETWLAWVYLVVIGSLLGYPVYLWLMRICPPAKAATIPYVNLLVAIFLGWSMGHETITLRLLFGTAIVVSSVAIVLWAKPKPA